MQNLDLAKLFDFTGQTVIVTGGARGIGYAIARRFHEAGANVVIADINEAAGRARSAELGERAIYVHADVGDENEVTSMMQQTATRYGGLDILVNNAGIFPTSAILDMNVTLWERVHATNLRGAFLCSRESARIMKASGGSIINISSIAGLSPTQENLAAYISSKHALNGLTKALALELAPYRIRVNALAPGGVNTEGVEEMMREEASQEKDLEAVDEEWTEEVPMKRYAEPDEIALPTLFLASEAASYITGSVIVVDGGLTVT